MSMSPAVHAKAAQLGKLILHMTTAAGSGHPSSALSIIHIVITLMYRQMRWRPDDPWHPDADRLVLSEGHAVPAVYAAYADLGGVVGRSPQEARGLTVADLETLREAGSVLDGHPNPAEGFPFFDSATGSLGQGLSAAAGLGLAARLRKSERRIYCIIGDGEAREGQVWEALDFIADQRLHNVVAIFNCNGQGQADNVSPQQSPDALAAKIAAFGWDVQRVDGHDADMLLAAYSRAEKSTRPIAIVAQTEKGWGVQGLRAKTNHGKPVSKADLAVACESLDTTAARLAHGATLDWRPSPPAKAGVDAHRGRTAARPESGGRDTRAEHAREGHHAPAAPPAFEAALAAANVQSAGGKLSTRRAYGVALLALGRGDDRIVALDADVSNSTFAEIFAHHFPQRFFECKIAEQNMVSTAVGLAASGFIPFVSSFAKFLARAYDQIEMAAITRANIKLVGSHAGISLAADGPSQMSLPDVAFFRSLSTVGRESSLATHSPASGGAATAGGGVGAAPACVCFQPADAAAAYALTHLMARHQGMCYMRTHRPDVPLIYSPDTEFEIGGSHVLVRGDAVVIVTAGFMVHVCREVVANLAGRGVNCSLVDAYSLPISADRLISEGRRCGMRYLCVEDNYGGGIGSAVAEIISRTDHAGRVEVMTCARIPKSGRTPGDLLAMAALGPEEIAAHVQAMLQ